MQAKVGLVLVAAKCFWDKRVQSYRKLPELIKKDAENIVNRLSKHMGIVNTGIVTSIREAEIAIEEFKKEKIELLIICPVMWSEDQPLIKLVSEMGEVPLLLWCYSPYGKLPLKISALNLFRGSGTVGLFQASGPLKRLGKDFGFVMGDPEDEETIHNIVEYVQTAKLVGELQEVKVGLLPSRCEVMTDLYVDEFNLTNILGPALKYISVEQLLSASQEIDASRVKANVDELKRRYKIKGVSDKTLHQTVRASLGVAELVDRLCLDALAIDDLSEELHKIMGLRPCLYLPLLQEKDIVISMEGDITGAVAMLVLKRLANSPVMFTEFFNFDKTDNSVIAGHAGLQNPRLAENDDSVIITPDYELQGSSEFEGAWMEFTAKPGQVTLLQIAPKIEGFKMIIATGEASGPGGVRVEGFPHVQIKFSFPLDDFFNEVVRGGATHHWAMVHGDVKSKLKILAELLKIEKLVF